MIEISHTAADGTLVDGTSRGDGSNVVLKAQGFRWFRTLGMWGLPSSRDRQSNRYKIDRAADALRSAGFEVSVSVDDSHRPTAEVEADLAARQQARADALDAKAERKQQAAGAAWEAHQRACEALPPGGEPIHVGHHSERRHRNAIDRAHRTISKSVEADREADRVAHRAVSAATAGARRYNPVTVKNRLDKLEADQRRDQRQLDGYRRVVARSSGGVEYVDESAPASGQYRETVAARMSQRGDEIAYWRDVFADMQQQGVASTYSKETVTAGDAVKYRSTWYRVVRANAKTVSVRFFEGMSGTNKLGYHELSGHRTAAELAGATSLDG